MKQALALDMSDGDATASVGDAWSVVLELTKRGQAELEKSMFGLSGNQRRLLASIDGQRTLRECAELEPALQHDRLARDAARLVAFGLGKQVRGELPQDLLVSAMNLTARIPLSALAPLEPERTVHPMMPRVGASPHNHPQLGQAPPPSRSDPSWLLLGLFVAALVVALGWLAFLN